MDTFLKVLQKALSVRRLLFASMLIGTVLQASYWTRWVENPNNPVFNPQHNSLKAAYPCVLYNANRFHDHECYKMWFVTSIGGVDTIYYTCSEDGIHWDEDHCLIPLFGIQAEASHPVVVYDPECFGKGRYYYKIWYWDTAASQSSVVAIRYAESEDGIHWENDQPITQDEKQYLVGDLAYFCHLYGPSSVLYNDHGTNTSGQPLSFSYVMYYDVGDGETPEGSVKRIALAYSSNGVHWVRYGSEPVVIPSGKSVDWDGICRYRASVVQDHAMYHLYYSGSCSPSSEVDVHIGHATSKDGISWMVDPDNPIFYGAEGKSWREDKTYAPAVLYDLAGFSGHGSPNPLKMWFAGSNKIDLTLGYAENSSLDMSSIATVSVDRIWLSKGFVGSLSWVLSGTIPPGTTLLKYQIFRVDFPEGKKLIAEVSPKTTSYLDKNAKENSTYAVTPVFVNLP
ncbi:MAG: hypothetical protein JW769_00325 [Parachlamydiales bacterium]|nr:hypothetical protein [Parachlamydiales bacterium]